MKRRDTKLDMNELKVSDRESTSSRDQDQRRVMKWATFLKPRIALGFDNLRTIDIPAMISKGKGLSLSFESVVGWIFPKRYLSDAVEFDFCLQLSLSLFHLSSGTFFGSTWMGKKFELSSKRSGFESIKIDFNDIVYLISRITDPTCVGIVELVLCKNRKDNNLCVAQFGCGWTIINLFSFSAGHPPDIRDGLDSVTTTSSKMFAGSPRDLIHISDELSLASVLKELPDCSLQFKIYSNCGLLKAQHLLSENEIVGSFDLVPGLALKEVILPDSTEIKKKCCIGEEEYLGILGNYSLPSQPIMEDSISLKFRDCCVRFSDRSVLERRLMLQISDNLSSKGEPKILSRILKIGFHNGHTIVGGDWKSMDLNVSAVGTESLVCDSDICLHGFVSHELFAIIVCVEYEIGTLSPLENLQSVLKSQLRHGKYISTVCIGASAFVPFNGNSNILKNNADGTLSFELSSDEISSLVSSRPIFQNVVPDRIVSHRTESQADSKNESDNSLSINLQFSCCVDVCSDSDVTEYSSASRKQENEAKEVFISDAKQEDNIENSTSTVPVSESTYHHSASDPIVSGSSDGSSLLLDPKFYGVREKSEYLTVSHQDVDESHQFRKLSQSSGLIQHAMATKLIDSATLRSNDKQSSDQEGFLVPNERFLQFLKPSKIQSGFREISRADRSRFSRHGIHGTQKDSSESTMPIPKDIFVEMRDKLSVHDIGIQFVGFKPSERMSSAPRKIFFTFQFFSCPMTKTESLELLPAGSGQTHVLVRNTPLSRHEIPNTLKFSIDCNNASPTESQDFAEYLSQKSLYVDIWDSDSLLSIGCCTIPLNKLMRQGQSQIRVVIECDIVYSYPSDSSVSSLSVVFGKPVGSVVVGTVHVVLTNIGSAGISPDPSNRVFPDPQSQGLNWRVETSAKDISGHTKLSVRPRNSVRARPLVETTPELHNALKTSHRASGAISTRSLTSVRGDETASTLTYDEISLLFKKFQGSIRGTIQYAGDFLKLLNAISWTSILKKSLKVYRNTERTSPGKFLKCFIDFSDSDAQLYQNGCKDALRILHNEAGVTVNDEELVLLCSKISSNPNWQTMNPVEVVKFFESECKCNEWKVTSKRLRAVIQKSILGGIDINNFLQSCDIGNGYISQQDLRKFLSSIREFGELTIRDIEDTVSKFANGPLGSVSTNELCSFLGVKYLTSSEKRLRFSILSNIARRLSCSWDSVSERAFNDELSRNCSITESQISAEEFFNFLSDVGVLLDIDSSIVSGILDRFNHDRRINLTAFSRYLFENTNTSMHLPKPIEDAEELLRLLLSRVQKHVRIDEAFRHFDTNGDGIISSEELEKGLDELGLFDNLIDWKRQIPNIVRKFDSSGDGTVSLKEFFKYLGVVNYVPNILQRMTKVFALASESLTIEDIFKEFDTDGDGNIDAEEIRIGAIRLNLFKEIEISPADGAAVIAHFDHDSDGKISMREFVDFFSHNVAKAKEERKRKRFAVLASRFKGLVQMALSKGASISDLFSHFDKDRGGSVSKEELAAGLRSIKQFESLSEADIYGLTDILDSDKSGEISIEEFKEFIGVQNNLPMKVGQKVKKNEFKSQFRKIIQASGRNGLTLEKIFAFADRDRSGEVNLSEFKALLSKFQSFEEVSEASLSDFFESLDIDGNGKISLDEFKSLISDVTESPQSVTSKSVSPSELIINFIKKIAESDGGVVNLLAFLDDDGDGLITMSSLTRLLRREGLFNIVSQSDLASFLEKCVNTNELISSVSLLRIVEGRFELQAEIEEDLNFENDYQFSNDLVTRTLERKMRRLGNRLSKRGCDVESLFREYDTRGSGMIRRTEFLEIISKLGLYVLEKDRFESASGKISDVRKHQQTQINRLKFDTSTKYQRSNQTAGNPDFEDHVDSLSIVNIYRRNQKQQLLQRVLTHSLAQIVHIYPRFGNTSFFEHQVTNPFAHEERFVIEIDPDESELVLVTSIDEWLQLRKISRSVDKSEYCNFEADMFDVDGFGNTQIALIPQETVNIPFRFTTYSPHRKKVLPNEPDEPNRIIPIKIISSTHGHVILIIHVHVHVQSFIVDRNIRFFEAEHTIMKKKLHLFGYSESAHIFSDVSSPLVVNCVELDSRTENSHESRVNAMVHISADSHNDSSVELVLRYRCLEFPESGNFYLMIYDDKYFIKAKEIWHICVQTRQHLELHVSVGSPGQFDLVLKGDRFARRAKVFSSARQNLKFLPESTFQLIPGSFNRIAAEFKCSTIQELEVLINIVDVDSRELLSAWLLKASVTAPSVTKVYDVCISTEKPILKKIVFKNVWNTPRTFKLMSSNEAIMKARSATLDVAAQGSAYLRLWFNQYLDAEGAISDVYLCLNDESGRTEDCFQFRLSLD